MSVFSLSIKAAMETLSAPLPDDLVLVGVALKSAPKIVRIEPFFFLLLFMLMADMALWVISRVIQAHLMAPLPEGRRANSKSNYSKQTFQCYCVTHRKRR